MNEQKAILQVISEKIEDFLESDETKSTDDIFVSINHSQKEELLEDPLYGLFCSKYNEASYEELGVICSFTGIDIIEDDLVEEVTVELKYEGEIK